MDTANIKNLTEPDKDMTQMQIINLTHRKFKTTIINILKTLM